MTTQNKTNCLETLDSSNNEAIWREEFEKEFPGLKHDGKFNFFKVKDEYRYRGYLAARKKAQEEIDLKNDAMSIMSEKIFELKKELKHVKGRGVVYAVSADFRELSDENEVLENEIVELKKEIEDLKKEHEKISCAYCGELCAREIDELISHVVKCEKHPVFKLTNENQKLRELVMSAMPFVHELYYEVENDSTEKKCQEFLKEAIEVLK